MALISPIYNLVGLLLMFFSLAFVPSIAVAVIFDESTVGSFFGFFLITLSAGLLLFAASKKDIDSLTIHELLESLYLFLKRQIIKGQQIKLLKRNQKKIQLYFHQI